MLEFKFQLLSRTKGSLDACAKLQKATICFVMSIRPSVRPHETSLLPLDGFLRNLIFKDFSKIRPENPRFINPFNAELNVICHLLAVLGTHHIFHVSGLRVNIGQK